MSTSTFNSFSPDTVEHVHGVELVLHAFQLILAGYWAVNPFSEEAGVRTFNSFSPDTRAFVEPVNWRLSRLSTHSRLIRLIREERLGGVEAVLAFQLILAGYPVEVARQRLLSVETFNSFSPDTEGRAGAGGGAGPGLSTHSRLIRAGVPPFPQGAVVIVGFQLILAGYPPALIRLWDRVVRLFQLILAGYPHIRNSDAKGG